MGGAVRKLYGEVFLKDKASKGVNKLNKDLNKTKQKAIGLQGAIQAVGAGLFLKKTFDVVSNMIDLSDAFEQTSKSMEVMTGSAATAKSLLEKIDKMSIETPLEPDQLSDTAKMLMGYGITVKKMIPTLRMLGDISGGNAFKFQRLSYAFAQASGAGRLLGQDFRQMIDAGLPGKEMAKALGMTFVQLKEKMGRGEVTMKLVNKAFVKMTSEGGKFHGMMAALSKTWGGLITTYKGFKGVIFRKIGDIFVSAFKPVLEMINKLLLRFVKFIDTERGMAILKISILALSTAVGVVLVGALWVAVTAAKALILTMLPIIALALAVAAAVAVIYLIVDDIITAFQGGESVAGDIWKWFLGIIKLVPKKILWVYNYVISLFYKFLNFLGDFGMDIIRALIPIDFFMGLIDSIIDTFKNLPGKIWNSIKGLSSSVLDWFSGDDTAKKPAGRANGGHVSAGTSYIVGEQGAELFTPGASGFITPSGSTNNRVSIKNIVGSIQITVQNATEGAEEIKDIILDALNDLSENIFPAESGLAIT